MEAHAPATGLSDMSVLLGTSTHGGTSSGGQSSYRATMDTFQGHGGEDERRSVVMRSLDRLSYRTLRRLNLRNLQALGDAVRLTLSL